MVLNGTKNNKEEIKHPPLDWQREHPELCCQHAEVMYYLKDIERNQKVQRHNFDLLKDNVDYIKRDIETLQNKDIQDGHKEFNQDEKITDLYRSVLVVMILMIFLIVIGVIDIIYKIS